MNPIANHGGDALMNLGAGLLTGAIVAQAFASLPSPAYGWLSLTGVALLAVGYGLKFVNEDWRLD